MKNGLQTNRLTLPDHMKIQDQVYKLIQERLKRICFKEWNQAEKTRKGYLKRPLVYSAEVDRLIELSYQILDMNQDQAESIATEVTTGSIQYSYLS